jgi:hypothetical protein
MNGTKMGVLLLAAAGLFLSATSSLAGAYLTGKVSAGNYPLLDPKIAVYDVKCKTKAPICGSVWDQSPNFSYPMDLHVTTLCISPVTQKGKGGMQFYERFRDGGQFSPKACTPACTEALVTVECDLNSDDCNDTYALSVECYGGDFATGFPKKIQ